MKWLKMIKRRHSCGSFAQVEVEPDLDQSRRGSKDGLTTEFKTH
jgi:hypothetical protein